MEQKLNHIYHDPRAGTVFISLRPRSQRRPDTALEYPGRVILDLDGEGDVYGIRLLNVSAEEAERIFGLLKSRPEGTGGGGGGK
jgi:hypothetical protein